MTDVPVDRPTVACPREREPRLPIDPGNSGSKADERMPEVEVLGEIPRVEPLVRQRAPPRIGEHRATEDRKFEIALRLHLDAVAREAALPSPLPKSERPLG